MYGKALNSLRKHLVKLTKVDRREDSKNSCKMLDNIQTSIFWIGEIKF